MAALVLIAQAIGFSTTLTQSCAVVYFYFCARADLSGFSDFARTYEQHLVNARRYQRALNARKIMR